MGHLTADSSWWVKRVRSTIHPTGARSLTGEHLSIGSSPFVHRSPKKLLSAEKYRS
jgi:hypothetical protein